MTKKAIVAIIMAFLLFLALASASTEINIKTRPLHRVHIYVLDTNSVYSLLSSYHLDSNNLGLAKAVYNGVESKIKVKVQVADAVKTLQTEDFSDLATGSPLYLQVLSGNISSNYKELESPPETTAAANTTPGNETSAENTTNTTPENSVNETNSTISKITGYITSVGKSIFSNKTTIYIIGGLVFILVIVGFFIFRAPGTAIRNPLQGIQNEAAPKETRLREATSEEKTPQFSGEDTSTDLLEAQAKIKELQKEIKTIKKQEKIKEVERKLEEEKKELERLKSED